MHLILGQILKPEKNFTVGISWLGPLQRLLQMCQWQLDPWNMWKWASFWSGNKLISLYLKVAGCQMVAQVLILPKNSSNFFGMAAIPLPCNGHLLCCVNIPTILLIFFNKFASCSIPYFNLFYILSAWRICLQSGSVHSLYI